MKQISHSFIVKCFIDVLHYFYLSVMTCNFFMFHDFHLQFLAAEIIFLMKFFFRQATVKVDWPIWPWGQIDPTPLHLLGSDSTNWTARCPANKNSPKTNMFRLKCNFFYIVYSALNLQIWPFNDLIFFKLLT